MNKFYGFLLVLLILLSFYSCSTNQSDQEHNELNYLYKIPENTGDGWETGSLEEAGLDEIKLTEMMNRFLNHRNHLVHSILIVRHGKLVFEEYFPGVIHPTRGTFIVNYDRDTLHSLSSVTKSYTSALLGIAIEKGFIDDINQSVFKYFPELNKLNTGEKKDLTIRHMITMSAGIQWDQDTYPIIDPRNDLHIFQLASDPWEWYLSRPLVTSPGTTFLYSEACINVVGEIIKRSSGMRLDLFAETYLFNPLGIENHWWASVLNHDNWIWASGDLRQTPRDMARFGLLYLNKGVWDGNQLVPAQWIANSKKEVFAFTPPFWSLNQGLIGYGYAWWLKQLEYGTGAFAASGWGEQYIIVMPELDMVTIFTGGSYFQSPPMRSHAIMMEYVLPAIKSPHFKTKM